MIPILAFLLLSVLYMQVALPLPQGSFVPLVGALPLAAFFYSRRANFGRMIGMFLLVALFVGLNVLFTDEAHIETARRLRSGIQLPYILLISSAILWSKPLEPRKADQLAFLLLAAAAIAVVLGILEPRTVVGRISDAFREVVYGGDGKGLYAADQRDMMIAGRIRPKVFTSEPSHAAWGVCALALAALGLSTNPRIELAAFGVIAGSVAAFFSPTGPATLAAAFTAVAVRRTLIGGGVWRNFWPLAVAGGIVLAALPAVWSQIEMRFLSVGEWDDSVRIRLFQPFELAGAALDYNPLFGVGFGGLESIWHHFGVIEGGEEGVDLNRSVGMALLSIPLYTGLLGSVLFVAILWRIGRRIPNRQWIPPLLIFLFALLQKASIVITPAWILGALWVLQTANLPARKTAAASAAGRQKAPRPGTPAAGVLEPALGARNLAMPRG